MLGGRRLCARRLECAADALAARLRRAASRRESLAWQRDTEHIQKSLVFAGFPARNGVSAALLIQFGGTGVDDIFAGADNFLLAFRLQRPIPKA